MLNLSSAKSFNCSSPTLWRFETGFTLSQRTNVRLFQTERKHSDVNSKFDKNGREFSKRIENTVGKGEIARYEHFLLFPWCFQKTCTADT